MPNENSQVIRTGETLPQESFVTLEGWARFFQAKKSPYRGEEGRCIGVCGDITEVVL